MDTEDPAEHMEHAEHAHHAKDPFDKSVAATMAVIAVILAVTAMLSHAANNKTLAKQVESGKAKTEASDQWAFYQAKKIRGHTDEAMIALMEANAASREPAGERPAETAQIAAWKKEIAKYEKDAAEISDKATEAGKESVKLQDESEAQEKKADVLDLGELTVQVALVLCSVAILSKRHAFWFAGIAVAAAGVVIGGYGVTMHGGAAEGAPSAPATHAAP